MYKGDWVKIVDTDGVRGFKGGISIPGSIHQVAESKDCNQECYLRIEGYSHTYFYKKRFEKVSKLIEDGI